MGGGALDRRAPLEDTRPLRGHPPHVPASGVRHHGAVQGSHEGHAELS